MKKEMRTMKFAKTALKNLFSEPVTVPYPEKPFEYPERTRGHIEVDIDTCVLCGLCSRKCPSGVITVNRVEKTWKISPFGCIQCGCCVEICPKKCLSMKQSYTQPGSEKKEEIVIKTNMPDPVVRPAAPAAKPVAPAPAAPAAKPVTPAPAVPEAKTEA